MSKVVIDTNVLVSALWSQNGNPNRVVRLVSDDIIIPYFCQKILNEYIKVLHRPKFGFSVIEVNKLVRELLLHGVELDVAASKMPFPDESDRIFYDTAHESGSFLITGNTKHYPTEPFIMTPLDYLRKINKG